MIKVRKRKIILLPGDGIGPEVIAEVKKVIQWFNSKKSLGFEVDEDLVGGVSYEKHKNPITDEVFYKALESEAVILGAVGGPKWDKLDRSFDRKGMLGVNESGFSDLLIDDSLSLDSIDDFLEPECSVENEFDFPFCDEDTLEDQAVVQNGTDAQGFPYPILIGFAFIIGIPVGVWLIWNITLRGKGLAEKPYIKMVRLATLGGIPIRNAQTPIEYGMLIGNLIPSIRENVANITWNSATTQYGKNEIELDSYSAESDWKNIRKSLLSRIVRFKFLT